MEVQTLSTEQKARVFAMYIGCPIAIEEDQLKLIGITDAHDHPVCQVRDAPMKLTFQVNMHECKLMLRPLSAITDEDAIEVAKIAGASSSQINERMGRQLIEEYITSSRCNVWGCNWMQIFQYLTQRGYAAPIYAAPGHPCNGKDAIQLGLAIDSTTI